MVQSIQKVDSTIMDCTLNIEKFKNAIKQLYIDAFERTATNFGMVFDFRQNAIDKAEQQLALYSAQNRNVGRSLYDMQIAETEKQIEDFYVKREQLSSDLTAAIANGVEVGSEEWASMAKKVDDVDIEILKAKTSVAEYNKEIAQLYVDAFDREKTRFENHSALWQDAIDVSNAQVGLEQAKGNRVGAAYYEQQGMALNNQLAEYEQERNKLAQRLSDAIANGVEVGSAEWYSMVDSLKAVDVEILKTKTSMEELDNTILQLHTDTFERIQARFNNLNSELSTMVSLFEDSKVATEDNVWTKEGLAQLGLLGQQYELASYRVGQYNQEMEYLTQQYKDGKYSVDEYNDKLAELKNAQMEQVKAAQSAKSSIVELNKARVNIVVEGINKETEAYKKLISEEKKALDAEKD